MGGQNEKGHLGDGYEFNTEEASVTKTVADGFKFRGLGNQCLKINNGEVIGLVLSPEKNTGGHFLISYDLESQQIKKIYKHDPKLKPAALTNSSMMDTSSRNSNVSLQLGKLGIDC